MNWPNTLISLILTLLCFAACKNSSNKDLHREEWQSLFNGKDINKWTANFNEEELGYNFKNTFRIEDSLLRVSYDEYDTFPDKFGHLFYSEEFSYYKLRSQYRFIGEQPKGAEPWAFRNNGLMLHSQHPSTMTFKQAFPLSLELQLLGGNGKDERTNGNLCTPGCDVIINGQFIEEHCIEADSPTYHGDQWITAEAIVLGDSIIHHIINDDTVITYSKPTIGGWLPEFDTLAFTKGTPMASGLIAIQAESHPTDFKYIEVLNLCGCMDKTAKNYKSYYIKSDQSKCLY